MRKVKVKANSPVARLAAKAMGFPNVAIVFGSTIHLHNATAESFLANRRWVLHELKHVEQYERGFLKFLGQYLLECKRMGYYNNKFEVEARAAEDDVSLLKKYMLDARF